MTTPHGPIATTYVEVRPTRDAKQTFQRDVEQVVEPAARATKDRIGKAVTDGLKSPVGATAAGAAIGTLVGQGIGTAVRASLRGLTAIPRTGFAELKDYEAGLSQLKAGLKSTGGVAGVTVKQLEELAGSIQKYSGQTDDSIVSAEAFLLTFSKVRNEVGKGNDIFDRTTKAAADLAARGFGTAESSAIQLGKAMQDPERGLVGLTRAGITFTDSQRKQIKTLDESGRSLEAQRIILAEVERQVGGSAKAYGETLPGEIDRGKRAFEDISQTIVGTTFTFVDHHRKTTAALAGVVAGIFIAHKAVRAYQALQETLLAGTVKKAAANAALARSYDAVATSAGRAAEAETIEGAAGGGAGGRVRNLLSKGGALAVAGGATAAIVATGVAVAVKEILDRRSLDTSIEGAVKRALGQGPDAARAQAAKYGVTPGARPGEFLFDPDIDPDKRDAGFRLLQGARGQSPGSAPAMSAVERAIQERIKAAADRLAQARTVYADPTKRDAEASSLAGTLGSPFSELPARQGDVAGAREAQRRADEAVHAAQVALSKVRDGAGGATAAQIAAAEATVATRQTALRRRGGDPTSERLGLEAAEARLAELRGKGGVNTDKLRAAEEKLREARVNAANAAKDTATAEQGTALSLKTVMDRISGQLKNTQQLRDDSKQLISKGISRGVLEELDKLEKDAPGTLDKVAKSMTPALAKQLNSQYDALTKVQSEFLTAPLRAAVEQAKAEQDKILNEAAQQQYALYAKALADAGMSLSPNPATPTGPGGRYEAPEPRGEAAVVLQVQGYGAQQVRQVAKTELARAERQAAHMIALQG